MTSRYEGEPRGPQSDTSRTSVLMPAPNRTVHLKNGDRLSIVSSLPAVDNLAAALATLKNAPYMDISFNCKAVLRVDSSGNLALTLFHG